MDYTTSTDLWKALEKLYSTHSKSRMNATRAHIQTNRKGKSIMEEDLKQMKSWVDVLAIVRNPYLEPQLVANMLFGLDREYMHIAILIESRDNITWQELHELLLNYDSKLDHVDAFGGMNKVTRTFSANYAANRRGNNNPNNKGRS
ncbi:hypothetical protein Pint_18196 [Pistacia integerrima]|uniref:Uncharacterized protein n=1 Tax=Pistacia integerrima TaxID=434235 RepID=A0ACC0Z1K7_9ROSI|nr:hypothetical protein Pint_18196 [Pistacia integerrima]